MKLRTKAAVAVGCLAVLVLGTVPVVADHNTCDECGPGPNWIDIAPNCQMVGLDVIDRQGAKIGLDLNFPLDCVADTSLILGSCDPPVDFIVERQAANSGTMDTEILDLCMNRGDVTMLAGRDSPAGGIIMRTLGSIVEDAADNTVGHSEFDVFFEIDIGGVKYYNQAPLVIASDITCVPPQAKYFHPAGCTPLFDSPDPGQGTLIGNLVSAQHDVNVPPIPTVSEWSLIIMTVLAFTAGTILIGRRRRAAAA